MKGHVLLVQDHIHNPHWIRFLLLRNPITLRSFNSFPISFYSRTIHRTSREPRLTHRAAGFPEHSPRPKRSNAQSTIIIIPIPFELIRNEEHHNNNTTATTEPEEAAERSLNLSFVFGSSTHSSPCAILWPNTWKKLTAHTLTNTRNSRKTTTLSPRKNN